MRLQYVANARLPSRKAHTLQIVEMCDGFTDAGQEVELIAPRRWSPSHEIEASPEEYYDAAFSFDVTYLPCIDLLWLIPSIPNVFARPIFYLQAVTFTISALCYSIVRSADATYTRSLLFAIVAGTLLRRPVLTEVHRGPPNGIVRSLTGVGFDRLAGIVAISEALREDWRPLTTARILVAPDAVSVDRFDASVDRRTLRRELSLPMDRPVAVYAGSVQSWKGVDTLVRAARQLNGPIAGGIHVCIVGGGADQLEWLRKTAGPIPENVELVGHVRPELVPRYLLAGDVLVVPNTAERDIAARYTSPLKVFEYMAAKRPIVASDIPSLREVLDKDCAYFCAPDNPESLADAIECTATEPAAEDRASVARERVVARHTWEQRAERISDGLLD